MYIFIQWIIKIYIFLFSAKIVLFYIIFYAALVGFFAAMLVVFYQTLDTRVPKWQLDSSLIGSNPGEFVFRSLDPREVNFCIRIGFHCACDGVGYDT